MKKAVVIFSLAAIAFASCKNESKQTENKDLISTDIVHNPRSANGTDTAILNGLGTMTFKDTVYDFGTINEGEVVTHDFDFTNTGKEPLVISNGRGSCGCTVPKYPAEPVAPGKSEKINVQFNSQGKTGHQEKSITITTNGVRGTYMLFVKGEVKPKKD